MVTSVPMSPIEGVGFYVYNLSNYLIEKGHDVQIITRSQRNKPYYQVMERIPVWRPKFIPLYPLHIDIHGLFVQYLVNHWKSQIDLFHFHTPLPPPVETRHLNILTVHSLMVPDSNARRIYGLDDFLTRLQAPVSSLIEKKLFNISRIITAVSPLVGEQVKGAMSDNKLGVEIMWNGVDANFFKPEISIQANPRNLLYVGRLWSGKGLPDLINAFKIVITRFPDASLSIVGSGPLHKKLVDLVQQNKLESNVKFIGHVSSRETIRDLYRQAWGLVVSSHHEALPGVLLEAMACGTPAIATKVGAIPNVIDNEANGILVNPRHPEGIADAIFHLFTDHDFRNSMGKAARETILQQFTWNIIGKKYLSIYQEMLL